MRKTILEYGLDIDRRQRKTQVAIESAILELMSQKSIEQITIKELAEAADINRKTFYNNYNSINDVLESIEAKFTSFIFDALPEQITLDNGEEIHQLLLNLAISLEPYRDIMKHLIYHHNTLQLQKKAEEKILPYVESNLLLHEIDAQVVPYINRYVLNGIFAIFGQWLIGKDTLTPHQVAQLAYNLTYSAIRLENYKDLTTDTMANSE